MGIGVKQFSPSLGDIDICYILANDAKSTSDWDFFTSSAEDDCVVWNINI